MHEEGKNADDKTLQLTSLTKTRERDIRYLSFFFFSFQYVLANHSTNLSLDERVRSIEVDEYNKREKKKKSTTNQSIEKNQ